MGLTKNSVGRGATRSTPAVSRRCADKVIALAGNPNVGKSTVFNGLTGMNQHTGNWPGKTVASAQGYCKGENDNILLVDIPGTYSLMAHSAEEEVARDFICFEKPDAVIVVCDATCLERNLNLVLQILEVAGSCVVCVNLMDDARRKGIALDFELLEKRLGVPVVECVARSKKCLKTLISTAERVTPREPLIIEYEPEIERAAALLIPHLENKKGINPRWLALRLLENDESLTSTIKSHIEHIDELESALLSARQILENAHLTDESFKDSIVSRVVAKAEKICEGVVSQKEGIDRDRRIDKILTGKFTAYPLMLALLALVFWLTISGANYPSALLTGVFDRFGSVLRGLLQDINSPLWLEGALIDGLYCVLAWVIAVMLPPMAIFFPFFTLLEDLGYLPRIAYNLDGAFKKCGACGKQALTMCMGFGCNAAGVVGCRIIDSPRERLLAILTNSLVPCNGRFPTIISIITIFFLGTAGGFLSSAGSALILTAVILIGVFVSLLATKILSKTLLKGVPSSFTLELPPYRKPQIGKILVRSVFDRTLFVLGRAAAVAAPAGVLIWTMANIQIGGVSLLAHCCLFLEPIGNLLGLDGVILMAFILGFPANETVVPIMIMAYTAQGSLAELSLDAMRTLFLQNGWGIKTAVCFILFSLMHWPCSTTLISIKKETGSVKWTLLAAAMPTALGVAACLLVNLIF